MKVVEADSPLLRRAYSLKHLTAGCAIHLGSANFPFILSFVILYRVRTLSDFGGDDWELIL